MAWREVFDQDWLLRARTAAGEGSLEERLLRLMVWAAAVTWSAPEHTLETDPLRILQDGRAWCDQQCLVFIQYAHRLAGVAPSRLRALNHTDGQSGHTVCEVWYEGAWHLFDVSTEHQTVYRHPEDGHILSYAELVADPSVVVAAGHWWHGLDGAGKEGFYQAGPSPTFLLVAGTAPCATEYWLHGIPTADEGDLSQEDLRKLAVFAQKVCCPEAICPFFIELLAELGHRARQDHLSGPRTLVVGESFVAVVDVPRGLVFTTLEEALLESVQQSEQS